MKVKIPTPLYSYTKNKAVVSAVGKSIDQVTLDLDRQFPGIRFRMIDEQDKIRPHLKFFVNGSQVFELTTNLIESDDVTIVQAFSGG